jgi:hypothetical protein
MDRLEEFLSLLQGVRQTGDNKWEALCPAHDDLVASLSVARGDDGRVLCHCHAGCEKVAICHAVGKPTAWLFPNHGLPEGYRSAAAKKPKGSLVGQYDYHDEYGALLYQSCRYEDWDESGRRTKTFLQRRPNGSGGWINNMHGVRKVPYRLPDIIKSHKSEPVYVVEGEKHADKLASWGLIATCNVGGATKPRDKKWLKDYNQWFTGRPVVLLADNDDPGRIHIANVAENLKGIAASVVAVDLPGLPPKGDVLDWIAAGGTAEQLKQLTLLATIAGLPIEMPPAPEEDAEADAKRLERLCLDVFGEDEKGQAWVYSETNRKTVVIKDVNRLSYTQLLQICGEGARKIVYNGNDSTPDGMMRLSDAKQAIAVVAGKRRFEEFADLGPGVWEGRSDGITRDSILVVGAGMAAVLNGTGSVEILTRPRYGDQIIDLGNSDDWFDFDQLRDNIDNYSPTWATTTVTELETIFGGWWFGPKHQTVMPAVLSGLVIATWIQSLWRWRPQVFILGKSNSGKSTLFEFLAGEQHSLGLFGNLVISSGDATAAGISQTVKNSSKAIILDELENSKKRAGVFELLRNAGRGQTRLRGTTHQKASAAGIQHIVWAAATESGLKKEVDRNRFIIVNLLIPPPEKMGLLRLPPDHVTAELGQRLLAVAAKTAFRAVELSQYLKEHRPAGYHYRICESYSVPAASYAAAMGMDESQAVTLLEQFLGTTDPHEIEGDEERLLDAILQHIIPVKGGDRHSVAQALWRLINGGGSGEVDWALDSHGVHLLDDPHGNDVWISGEERCVFLNCSAVSKTILSHDREWEGINCKEILLRLEKAVECRKRISGRKLRGVLLPCSGIAIKDSLY